MKEVPNRPPFSRLWWPLWMFLLAVGLVVFYGFFTPAWIGIRAVAWISERSARARDALRTSAS